MSSRSDNRWVCVEKNKAFFIKFLLHIQYFIHNTCNCSKEDQDAGCCYCFSFHLASHCLSALMKAEDLKILLPVYLTSLCDLNPTPLHDLQKTTYQSNRFKCIVGEREMWPQVYPSKDFCIL